jgi:hypothetical protein
MFIGALLKYCNPNTYPLNWTYRFECIWDLHTHVASKTNSVAYSPQANYTDWATATVWRILMPTFAGRGVSRGQHCRTPTVINFSVLHWSRYYFFQVAPHLCEQGWVDPVPDPLLLRKSGNAGNWTRDLSVCSQELWPLDHRGLFHKISFWLNNEYLSIYCIFSYRS